MPLFGPPNIKNLEARKDVKGLIKALGYKNGSNDGQPVRTEAANALCRIGDVSAGEALIAMLDLAVKVNENREGDAAIKALGGIRDSRAVEFLIVLLNHSWFRASAATALGEIKDARAVQPLINALLARDSDFNKATSRALAQIGTPSVEPLLAFLKQIRPGTGGDAIWALGEIRDPRAVQPLIAMYRPDSRDGIPEALGKIGAPAADQLLRILTSDKRELHAMAAEALGAMKDVRAIEQMVAMLKDHEPETRRIAAEALKKMGWKPGHDADGARYWAELGQWQKCVAIGSPAVEPLLTMLGVGYSNSLEMAKASASALDALGWKPGADASAAYYWIAKHEWDQCVAIGAPAVEPLIAMQSAHTSDHNISWGVCGALAKIGDTRAVGPLIAALSHDNSTAVKAVISALADLKDPRAIQPLLAMLTKWENIGDRDGYLEAFIKEALGKLGYTS